MVKMGASANTSSPSVSHDPAVLFTTIANLVTLRLLRYLTVFAHRNTSMLREYLDGWGISRPDDHAFGACATLYQTAQSGLSTVSDIRSLAAVLAYCTMVIPDDEH